MRTTTSERKNKTTTSNREMERGTRDEGARDNSLSSLTNGPGSIVKRREIIPSPLFTLLTACLPESFLFCDVLLDRLSRFRLDYQSFLSVAYFNSAEHICSTSSLFHRNVKWKSQLNSLVGIFRLQICFTLIFKYEIFQVFVMETVTIYVRAVSEQDGQLKGISSCKYHNAKIRAIGRLSTTSRMTLQSTRSHIHATGGSLHASRTRCCIVEDSKHSSIVLVDSLWINIVFFPLVPAH